MKEDLTMRIDTRCKHLNELNDRYHLLFRQVMERYLGKTCQESNYPEPLCVGDFQMLFYIGEGGEEGGHMAAISKKLNINPSTATRRVNRLLTDGLVTKSTAPDDDRRFDLRLTARGSALLDRMDELAYDTVQTVYEPVTDREMQTVYRFLEKCIGQLERLADGNKDQGI